ncbi:hypothetical protein [Lentzea jiangxiensis]|uniref:hypothetical protein n=1 Tax=Lentzea jiangxiensis TaxID=641025 RepID=UPI0015A2EE37|nr:hypothetical protein [Lentzea jiangxiensis]
MSGVGAAARRTVAANATPPRRGNRDFAVAEPRPGRAPAHPAPRTTDTQGR